MTFSDEVMPYLDLRSNYSSFDASRQEKHDAGKINIVPLLRQKFECAFRGAIALLVLELYTDL